jgi:hypothetical protein
MTITRDQIEKRAYEFYMARGREEGKALDHWLAAKLDLLLEGLEQAETETNHPSPRFQIEASPKNP